MDEKNEPHLVADLESPASGVDGLVSRQTAFRVHVERIAENLFRFVERAQRRACREPWRRRRAGRMEKEKKE